MALQIKFKNGLDCFSFRGIAITLYLSSCSFLRSLLISLLLDLIPSALLFGGMLDAYKDE